MFSLFKKKTVDAPPAIIVPRIKNRNFLRAVDQVAGITDETRPIVENLVGDLVLTYAIDLGDNFEMVSASSLEKFKIQQQNLISLAKYNALPALRSVKTRSDGVVYELTAPDNMAACSIIFPQLWQQIEQQVGGPVIALFPHRDFVFFAREDQPTAVGEFNKIISQVNFNQTHALSKLIYRRTGDQWEEAAV